MGKRKRDRQPAIWVLGAKVTDGRGLPWPSLFLLRESANRNAHSV